MATDCTPLNDCYQIFTIGDLQVFTAMLNGVAMVFKNGGIAPGDGGLSIGLLAATGLLISLLGILLAGVMTQKVDVGQFLILIILFCILFVPKTKVLLTDTVTGNVAAVANVPIGVALPGHFISMYSRSITESFEIGYGNIDSNFIMNNQTSDSGLSNSLVGKAGITPLKLLRSLKSASLGVTFDSYLADDLANLVNFCVVNNPAFDMATFQVNPTLVTDVIAAGKTSGRVTVQWNRKDKIQEPISCEALATALEKDTSTKESSKFSDVITKHLNNTNAPLKSLYRGADENRTGSPNILNGYDFKSIQKSLGMVNSSWSIAASDSVQLAFFSSLINDAFRCSAANSSQGKLSDCLAMTQAQEQAREDGAGGGSLFQKIMVHGMNIMLAMFYLLSPLVAIVMISSGPKGIKIAGSFILFGIWSQSWLPVSVAINSYMYAQVAQDVQILGRGGLTIANMPQFYDILSTKIGLAGELLGAVPLFSLAILSGSIFGLTSVANRLSGKDAYDEKLAAPSLAQSAPYMQSSAALTSTIGQPASTQGGFPTRTINASQLSSSATTAAEAIQFQAMQGLSSKLGESITAGVLNDKTGQFQRQLVEAVSAKYGTEAGHTLDVAFNDVKAAENAKNIQLSNEKSKGQSSKAQMVANVSVPAGPLSFMFGGSTERVEGEKDSLLKDNGATVREAEGKGVNSSLVNKAIAGLITGKDFTKATGFVDLYKSTKGFQKSDTLEAAFSEAKSATENLQNVSSSTQGYGMNVSFTPEQLANEANSRSPLGKILEAVPVSEQDIKMAQVGGGQSLTPQQARYFAAATKIVDNPSKYAGPGSQLYYQMTGINNGGVKPVNLSHLGPGGGVGQKKQEIVQAVSQQVSKANDLERIGITPEQLKNDADKNIAAAAGTTNPDTVIPALKHEVDQFKQKISDDAGQIVFGTREQANLPAQAPVIDKYVKDFNLGKDSAAAKFAERLRGANKTDVLNLEWREETRALAQKAHQELTGKVLPNFNPEAVYAPGPMQQKIYDQILYLPEVKSILTRNQNSVINAEFQSNSNGNRLQPGFANSLNGGPKPFDRDPTIAPDPFSSTVVR